MQKRYEGRFVVLVLALILALGAIGCSVNVGGGAEEGGGGAEDEDLVVGVSNLGLSFPFPASIGEGIEEEAKEHNVEIIQTDAQGDVNKQTNDVQDLIGQNVDGILLLPVDSGVAARMADDIKDAGIPVIGVASQVGESKNLKDVYPSLNALATQSEVEAGANAGKIAVEALPDGGQIAVVEGAAGFAEVRLRLEGFKQALEQAGPNYEIVASQPGDWVPETARAACENMLSAKPNIDLIYNESDDMALGCNEAVGEKVEIIGVGGSGKVIDLIKTGEVLGTVCYRPNDLGHIAMEAMYKHLTGERKLENEFITYKTPPITKENIEQCTPPQW
jgi:ABC-type sugar transport system substrate-binding protein